MLPAGDLNQRPDIAPKSMLFFAVWSELIPCEAAKDLQVFLIVRFVLPPKARSIKSKALIAVTSGKQAFPNSAGVEPESRIASAVAAGDLCPSNVLHGDPLDMIFP